MDQNFKRKRTGVILIAGIAVIAFIFILMLTSSSPKPDTSADQPETTTATTPTTSPVPANSSPSDSQDAGKVTTDYLTSYGVTSQQLDALQEAIFKFAQSKGLNVRDATIDKSNIKHIPPAGSQDYHVYAFTLYLGDATYNAQMQAISVFRARLTLTNPQNNQQVFDSGVVSSAD